MNTSMSSSYTSYDNTRIKDDARPPARSATYVELWLYLSSQSCVISDADAAVLAQSSSMYSNHTATA
jgi:hypothetical protein